MRTTSLIIVFLLLSPVASLANELTYGWNVEAEVEADIGGEYFLLDLVETSFLGGSLSDQIAMASSGASSSASYTITGAGYRLGANADAAAFGEILVDDIYQSSSASIYATTSWNDQFRLQGDGPLPFNSVFGNWSLDGESFLTVNTGEDIFSQSVASIAISEPGVDTYFSADYEKEWDGVQITTTGTPSISGLLPVEKLLGPNQGATFQVELEISAFTNDGSVSMDFENSLELVSVTFPDGTTPESHGFEIVFDSGLPSPNVAGAPGDFDLDGDVDADEINLFSGVIGQNATGGLTSLDFDDDGVITLADHDIYVTTLAQTTNGETGALIGDINLDGNVDVLGDAFTLVGNLNSNGANLYAQGDLNADQKIDVLGDAFRLVGNLGQSNSTAILPNTSAVPEPGSIALLGITGLGIAARRKR